MYTQEGGLWRPRVLHEPKRFFVSEFHVARGGNAYGKLSRYYERGNNCPSPGARIQSITPKHVPGVRRKGLTRAALYARVSTDKQEREETVASQVALLQQTAEARGYDVLPGNVFIDDGVSGARLDRPALERLRDLAAEGTFDVLLVTAPDRLARRYAYQVVLVEELTRCGCEVVFVHQNLGASPEEQMLLQMSVFAEYERALIHERTRRGQLFAARQGRVNWGNPPYGYTYIHKTTTTPQHLRVNEAEAEVVEDLSLVCGGAAEFLCHSSASHAARGPTPQVQAQPVGPKECHRPPSATPSIKGSYYNRTQAGDVRRPYGLRGLKDRHPGNGQSRTRRPRANGFGPGAGAHRSRDLGPGARATGPESRARAAQQYAASVSVAESGGLWALWPAHGGHVECPGRPLYLRPALSSVCAGGMHGPQPQCDPARGMCLGAREGLAV